MGLADWIIMVFAIWTIVVSARTIRRIGIRRFSLAVGRLGWDLVKITLAGVSLLVGTLAATSSGRSDDNEIDSGLLGPDLMDMNDPANFYDRWDSPLYIAEDLDKKEGGQ
jgi:hypothetical protein